MYKADTSDVADVLHPGICTVPLRAWASYVVRHSIGLAPFSFCNVAETNVSNWSRDRSWVGSLAKKLEPKSWSLELFLDDFYSMFLKQIWRHGFQNSSFKLCVFFTDDPSPFIVVLKALGWRKRAKSLTEFWCWLAQEFFSIVVKPQSYQGK